VDEDIRKIAAERGLAAPPFRFVGEALALDFVNTEVMVRGNRRDLLASPTDILRWRDQAQQIHPSIQTAGFAPPDAHDMAAFMNTALQLRATLRRIFSAVAEQRAINHADLAHLNSVLQLATQALERVGDNRVRVVYQGLQSWHDTVLFLLARSAFELLTQSDLQRLHQCGNARCILMFYDTTRSATRHWCSSGCMNRARSARRYQQLKTRPTTE
jgi:predicted RNA-binding Zn ribbon-like protein